MNILQISDESIVSKTTLSRKLTLGGITKAYPVYKVRLDQLFYNDQNDRIATWITQYKNDTSNISFSDLSREDYNKIIEKFIIDSNPAAIEKTKNNIALVNQREPGVILSDGRIIDGNRRFTCLRLLNAEDEGVQYFETVILDASVENDQKQIKMLELAIQHGEEQRVDYNLIDMTIGAYHDIVETELLTIDEYVSSTNIPLTEVRRRLETAKLIIEFLEFMGVAKQYHIAREMQVYSVFYEMVPLVKRCDSEESKNELKRSVFSNIMMGSFSDQKKFIRNVKSMMDSGLYSSYIKKQIKIVVEIEEKRKERPITNKRDLDEFIKDNEDLSEDLQISMDRSLLQSKKAQTKSRPSQIVNKSLSMLMDIDTRIFDKLSEGEKEKLHTQLHKLTDAVSLIEDEVTSDGTIKDEDPIAETQKGRMYIAERHIDEPIVFCKDNKVISNLSFPLTFSAVKFNDAQTDEVDALVYFVNEEFEEICQVHEVKITVGTDTKVNFSLNSAASSLKNCYLVIKSPKDATREAQQMTKFNINIAFSVEFDF